MLLTPEKTQDLLINQKIKGAGGEEAQASGENRSQVPHHLHMCDIWQVYDVFQKHCRVFINEEMLVDLPKVLKFSKSVS